MLRVYLDQNKWIDLARARTGVSDEFVGVLECARFGVEIGAVSFPLSLIHYMETWNTRSSRRRLDLAMTMVALSRFHTMAVQRALITAELTRALNSALGRPAVQNVQVFGVGFSHASGRPRNVFMPPDGYQYPPGVRAQVSEWGTNLLEWVALSGPGVDLPVEGIDLEPARMVSEQYRRGQSEGAKRLVGQAPGDVEAQVFAEDLFDLLDTGRDRLDEWGITIEEIMSLSGTELDAFWSAVPTQDAMYRLRRLKLQNPQHPWKKGDLADIGALSCAVVYCDIIVTEREWAHFLRRSGLPERHSTVVLDDLAELTQHIV